MWKLLGKSKKGHKVSCNRSSLSERFLEQVKKSADADCGPQTVRRGYLAMKNGCWEDLKKRSRKEGKSSEWTLERIREAYEEVDAWGLVQEILRKSTDFLSRVIAPMEWEESLCRMFAHIATVFPLEDYTWWVSTGHGDGNSRKKRHCSWWCAARGGQHEWRAPKRILVVQLGTNANEAKVFMAHAAPQGLRDTLINALKLLAKQQKDGDCPIEKVSSQASMKEAERESWMG